MEEIKDKKFYYLTQSANILSIDKCRANPKMLFIFGDNEERFGMGGQAVIRREPNSMGIATKASPTEFWDDKHFKMNALVIDSDIQNIKDVYEKDGYKSIVFPTRGLGTGLAELNIRAPRTFLYLCQRLLDEFGFNNLRALKSD